LIEQNSFDRICTLPATGFDHAIRQNNCHLGLGRSHRFFDIGSQLGRPCAAWLLTMFLKCIALLTTALTLANCCASGNGCAPVSGAAIAWDGLGTAPTENTQSDKPAPKRHGRSSREIIIGPLDASAVEPNSKVPPKSEWEQQQAAEQADEVRLRRKLVICRDCVPAESAHDEATGSAGR
jgi:hypothetical protein